MDAGVRIKWLTVPASCASTSNTCCNSTKKSSWLMLIACLLMYTTMGPRVVSHSTGAPAGQCAAMVPGHPGSSLPLADAPYRITLSKNRYGPFEAVQVTIVAQEPFSGFMLQARAADAVDTTYVGKFQPAENTKFVCGQHGLTHISPTLKDSLTVVWRAPLTGLSNVVFRLTIVTNYFDYYVDMRSEVLQPKGATTTTTSTTTTALTTLTTHPVATTTPALPLTTTTTTTPALPLTMTTTTTNITTTKPLPTTAKTTQTTKSSTPPSISTSSTNKQTISSPTQEPVSTTTIGNAVKAPPSPSTSPSVSSSLPTPSLFSLLFSLLFFETLNFG